MLIKRRIVERYIIWSIVPYFGLSLILLTAALLAQQATKFAEIVGTARAPLRMALEVLAHLVPSILVITLPTAALVGTLLGLGRMSGDSELIALRASGHGTLKIAAPVLGLGLLLSGMTFYSSFYLSPNSAQRLRNIATEAASHKLESPVEPRTFYTEMPGKVVFVRDGNRESGEWGRVFIFWQESESLIRLVTARSGRIDSSGEQTELALSEAEVITLPSFSRFRAQDENRQIKITSERSASLRMRDERLDEGRKAFTQRIINRAKEPEEMNWKELLSGIRQAGNPTVKRTLLSVLHRKMALCFAPFAFVMFGLSLGLRTRRGGRGVGILISIITLLTYYLISVAGEQFGRSGALPVFMGAWMANMLLLILGIFMLGNTGRSIRINLLTNLRTTSRRSEKKSDNAISQMNIHLAWGLLDRYILRSLTWSFTVSFSLLTSVFIVFTLFDLLRFITVNNVGGGIIVRYLFFVFPYASVALAPMGVLVAVLATYALIARRSESVAWWATGQSVYRIIIPGVIFASLVGACLWILQEEVAPHSNRVQNKLRSQIRGGAQAETSFGRQWSATVDLRRFYVYRYDPTKERLLEPMLLEFDAEGVHLDKIVVSEYGELSERGEVALHQALIIDKDRAGGVVHDRYAGKVTKSEPAAVFKPVLNKPEERSFKQLSEDLKREEGRVGGSVRSLEMGLESKRSGPLSTLILALLGMPLAFLFGKRSTVTALSFAVLIGLAFWATSSVFFYFGVKGVIPVFLAAWLPSAIFLAIGIYFLARSPT